jgi:glycosyltransferase involved in cell wall biosynthesis
MNAANAVTVSPTTRTKLPAPRTGGGAGANARALRVLILGPFNEAGGLARVARMSAEGFDANRFDLMTCDTSRDTEPGRTLPQAILSHTRRMRRLLSGLRRHRPDLVHIHTCSYGTFHRSMLDAWVCAAFRTPYVLHIHGGRFAEYLASLRGARRAMVVRALRKAQRVVVLSESWRTSLTRLVSGLRIAVVPNAVDADALPAGESAAGHAEPTRNGGGGVAFVGDLSETKRPEDLLVAYSALPGHLRKRFGLTLIGDGCGERRELLEKLAVRLGISQQTRLTGGLSHTVVRECLAAADLFVLPSKAEGMPLALLEAMAAGAPVVATSVGAVAEIARDGEEAILVQPRDVHALTRAMRTLLENPTERQALAQAGQQRCRAQHAPPRFRDALTEVWAEATPKGRRAVIDVPKLAVSRSIL